MDIVNIINTHSCKNLKVFLDFEDANQDADGNIAINVNSTHGFLPINPNLHLFIDIKAPIENNAIKVFGIVDNNIYNQIHELSRSNNDELESNKCKEILKSNNTKQELRGEYANLLNEMLNGSLNSIPDYNSSFTTDNLLNAINAVSNTYSFSNVKITLNGVLFIDGKTYILNQPYLSFEQIDKSKDGIVLLHHDNITINQNNNFNTAVGVMDGKNFSVNFNKYNCKDLKVLLALDDANQDTDGNTTITMNSQLDFLSINFNLHLKIGTEASIENNAIEVFGIADNNIYNQIHELSRSNNDELESNKYKELLKSNNTKQELRGEYTNLLNEMLNGSLNSLSTIGDLLNAFNPVSNTYSFSNLKITLNRVLFINGTKYTLNQPYLSFEQIDKSKDGIVLFHDSVIIINHNNNINTAVGVLDGKNFSVNSSEHNVVKNITLKMPEIMAYTLQACNGFASFVELSGQCVILKDVPDDMSQVNSQVSELLATLSFQGLIDKIEKVDTLHIIIYITKGDFNSYLSLSIKAKNSANAIQFWNLAKWFTYIEEGIFGGKSNGSQQSQIYIERIQYVNTAFPIFNFEIKCTSNTLSKYEKKTNFLYLTNVESYKENIFFVPSDVMIITPNYLQLKDEVSSETNLGINLKKNFGLNAQINEVNGKIFVGMNAVKDIIIDKKSRIITIIARNDNIFECKYKYDPKIEKEEERHLYDQISEINFISSYDSTVEYEKRNRKKIEINGFTARLNLPMSVAKSGWDHGMARALANSVVPGFYYVPKCGLNSWGTQRRSIQIVKFADHVKKISKYAQNNFIRGINYENNFIRVTGVNTNTDDAFHVYVEGEDAHNMVMSVTSGIALKYKYGKDVYQFIDSKDTYFAGVVYYSCYEWETHCKGHYDSTSDQWITNPDGNRCTAEDLVGTWAFYERNILGQYLNDFIYIEGKDSSDTSVVDLVFEFTANDKKNLQDKSIILPQYYTYTGSTTEKEVAFKIKLPQRSHSGFSIAIIDAGGYDARFTNIFSSDDLDSKSNRPKFFSAIVLGLQILITVASLISKIVKASIKNLTDTQKDIFKWFDFVLDLAYAATTIYDVKILYSTITKTGITITKFTGEQIGKLVKSIAIGFKAGGSAVIGQIISTSLKKIFVSIVAQFPSHTLDYIAENFLDFPQVKSYLKDLIDRWSKGLQETITNAMVKNDTKISEEDKVFITDVANIIIAKAFESSSNTNIFDQRLKIKSQNGENGDFVILKYLQNIQQFGAGYIYSSANKKLTMEEALFLQYIFIQNNLFQYIMPFQELYGNYHLITVENDARGNIDEKPELTVEYTKCPFIK